MIGFPSLLVCCVDLRLIFAALLSWMRITILFVWFDFDMDCLLNMLYLLRVALFLFPHTFRGLEVIRGLL